MRVTVLIGNEKLRIPVDEGSKTMSWLQAEVIRRWERLHKGDFLHIKELRTADNIRLDNEDQVFEVCKDDENIVIVLGTGTEKEVGPGDMINQYYLSKLIGEGTYGRGETTERWDAADNRQLARGGWRAMQRRRGGNQAQAANAVAVGNRIELFIALALCLSRVECALRFGSPLSVYMAHDLNLNRQVAVKVLRREKANEVNTRRFLREAELNGSLSSSPFVASVYDFGRTRGGTLFIVMELLEGSQTGTQMQASNNEVPQPCSPIRRSRCLFVILRWCSCRSTYE